MNTQETTTEFALAVAQNADRWVPACGGHEKPFIHDGTRYLYCYNPRTEDHIYINVDTDTPEPFPPFMGNTFA